jgi:NAD(P)-dependent dehydrogenase (short-subunit alcohol dehydrogenase family)
MDLQDKVVVITGASSGLGRAAALQFAKQRSIVVLAARRVQALEETARLCRQNGGRAVTCQSDVSREDQVRALAAEALKQTGQLDVWVNNAGITCFAPLDSERFDEHRQVLETNLFGPIFAARAVVPIFRRQGYGTMINVGSVLSKIGQPFVPSYVISKFGLQGLTETLRAALADMPHVHICSLLPYAMDTEHFESGANEMGAGAHPLSPLQSPEKVALALVELARRGGRQRLVPRSAGLGLALHFLAPRLTERVLLDVLRRWHFGEEPVARTSGNAFVPTREAGAVHGERAVRVTTPRLMLYAAARMLAIPVELTVQRLRAPVPRPGLRLPGEQHAKS